VGVEMLTIIEIRCSLNVVSSGGDRLGSSELLSGEGFHFVRCQTEDGRAVPRSPVGSRRKSESAIRVVPLVVATAFGENPTRDSISSRGMPRS
jgi:hypothetical protein